MTNQQLKAHCEDVIANPQDHLGWVVDMAKEALAALTQPASPALKLPDGWVAVPLEPTPGMMVAGTLVSEFQEDPSGMYRAMVAAAPSVPHTAPIEPICATGGAEWTGNSLSNDALIMLGRIDTSDSADDDRIEEVKRIIRLLAEVPEA